jgi:hypothetical protein
MVIVFIVFPNLRIALLTSAHASPFVVIECPLLFTALAILSVDVDSSCCNDEFATEYIPPNGPVVCPCSSIVTFAFISSDAAAAVMSEILSFNSSKLLVVKVVCVSKDCLTDDPVNVDTIPGIYFLNMRIPNVAIAEMYVRVASVCDTTCVFAEEGFRDADFSPPVSATDGDTVLDDVKPVPDEFDGTTELFVPCTVTFVE